MTEQPLLSLRDLLNSASEAALRAGEIIRKVDSQRNTGKNSIGAVMKDSSCDRSWVTTADVEAEELMCAILRQAFPDLTIVGEEGCGSSNNNNEIINAIQKNITEKMTESSPPLPPHSSVTTVHIPAEYESVPLSSVVVFIDPLDGTREFVEGRIRNVQTLIGVSVRGRAVGGVVGLPFWSDDLVEPVGTTSTTSSMGAVLCGVVGSGVVGGLPVRDIDRASKRIASTESLSSMVVAASMDDDPVLVAARNILTSDLGCNMVSTGAAGNKILSVLRGEADMALLNLKTSLWDTCATEAILAAVGGRMTDLFGGTISHREDARQNNIYGVIATRKGIDHASLCKKFR